MNWSCLTGYLNFNIPPFNVCLAEEFIRYSDKGYCHVGTQRQRLHGSAHDHDTHSQPFPAERRFDPPGEATTQTKVEYLQIPQNLHPELMNMYIFFGDPAVELALPVKS